MGRRGPGRDPEPDHERAAPPRSVFPGFADADGLLDHLVELRREQGLSQTTVAARMHTSQSAVARLEAGDADARLSTLARYASALGTEVRFVVPEPEPEPDPGPAPQEAPPHRRRPAR